MKRAPVATAAFVLAGAVPAQSTLYTLHGDGGGDLFGISVDGVGDWDRDGVPDFAVGADQSTHVLGHPPTGPGYARVFSGANGTVLATFAGLADDDWYGSSVAGLGDADGDGFPELAVGARDPGFPGYPPQVPSTPPGPGYVQVRSGADGSLLFTAAGDADYDHFGAVTAGVGDVDGNGRPDLAVGAPFASSPPTQGLVRLFDGLSGAELYTLAASGGDQLGSGVDGIGDWNGDGMADFALLVGNATTQVRIVSGATGVTLASVGASGTAGYTALAGCGDVDGDGLPDLLVGARLDAEGAAQAGSASLLSGAGGATLYKWLGDDPLDNFGQSVAGAGDVDADGVPDLLVGAWDDDAPGLKDAGCAHVFSGATGIPLGTLCGATADTLLGAAVAGVGDLNLDGRADLLAGGYAADFNGPNAGHALAFSAADLPLEADLHELSLASGGTQTLLLDAGAEHASQAYLTLGSLSGTAPGVALDGHVLPLNPDVYLTLTLIHPAGPPLSGGVGLLGPGGEGTVAFVLPPGTSPSFAGLTAHHAYLVLGAASIELASNPVPLAFLP